ncbi:MAG: chromosome condensation regulator RCC1 [Deltaproteobacteria bacterium]|nr:chromosome condensation regulator RCC1 [Deltaproteobacteria bacterium]
MGRRGRRRAALLLGMGLTASATWSCAAIVGVEDVRLRARDAAQNDEEELPVEDSPSGGDTVRPPASNVLTVALGKLHTCARKTDFTVRCWGDNTSGQLGTSATADGGLSLVPVTPNVKDAIAIASGDRHTCVVLKDNTVRCWGQNQDGQLGNGQSNTSSSTPVTVTGLTDAVAVACGATFSCALRTNGRVACWGDGLAGQLGTGMKGSSSTAVEVGGLDGVVAISAGEAHACAVRSSGAVSCWGDNANGQLGTGSLSPTQSSSPVIVPTLDDVAQVAAAQRSTCARKRGGGVLCWGANELGQLGSGAANPTPNPSPSIVSGLDASMIWAGSTHACAVSKASASSGAVLCWGAGGFGQIGDGQTRDAGTATPVPTRVNGITNAIGVGTGGEHACAPSTTGTIQCWGNNARGQVGNNKTGQESSPDGVIGFP